MKLKKPILIFLLFFLLVSLVTAAPPFITQSSEADGNALQIVYPKNPAFPKDQEFRLHFHIFNSSGSEVLANQVSCFIHIYNSTNRHLYEANLTDDSNQVDKTVALVASYSQYTGTFPYLLYCNSTPFNQDGFLSAEYRITTSGEYLEDYAFVGIALILVAVFSFYFYLAVNWNFKLFSTRKDEKDSIVKAFIILIAIWLMTVPIQYATEIAEATLLNDGVILLELLYQVQLWFNWIISVIMVIYFLFNLFLYLSNQSKQEGAGKLLR